MKRRSFLRQATVRAITLTAFNKSLAYAGSNGILKNTEREKTPFDNSGENPVKVAVVQQDGNPGEVETNRKKALEFAEKTLAHHADVISEEGIILSDVYPGQVEQIRKENPWYNGLRPDLYHYK